MPEMNDIVVDQYAVMGNPVSHSKSPFIHSEFARETGQQLDYTAICVEPGHLTEAVSQFYHNHGKGLNITVPFKQDAWQLASQRSERAQRAGAVNTLVLNSETDIYGDTTDGVGLIADLTQNHGIDIKQRKILILGAGGAVRGVLEPLLQLHPQQLVIANRTVARATELARDFAGLGPLSGCGFAELQGETFDLVINGTSASLAGELPPLPEQLLTAEACVYDMMYGAKPTVFMQWGKRQGAVRCLDGLGMLVEQAAESFFIWRGVRPQTDGVIRSLRESMQ